MSKQSLSDSFQPPAKVYRTSKTDEVSRYLLYSMAQMIGKHTLKMVLKLCPRKISEYESRELDEIITGFEFSHAQIEEAARIVIENGCITFQQFHAEIISR